MFHRLVFNAILIAVASSPFVSAACGGDKPVELCCRTVEPYYENEYVFKNVCNITVSDPNELTGSFCNVVSPSTCATFGGFTSICCETSTICQSGVDGPIGLNCVTE